MSAEKARRPPAESCTAVARRLGVAPGTVRLWCREGVLRGRVVRTAGGHYRIPAAVVEALLSGELVAEGPAGTSNRQSVR